MKVGGMVYHIRFKRGEEVFNIRIWKIPYEQRAIVRVGQKEAIFKFTKEGAEQIDGEKFPTEMEDTIKSAIMKYLFNSRIHK